jgi:hypothetical protein
MISQHVTDSTPIFTDEIPPKVNMDHLSEKKTASKLLCEKINVYMGLWAYCIQKLELPINLRFIPSSSAVKSNPVQWLNPQHGPPSIRHFSLPVSLKGNPKS